MGKTGKEVTAVFANAPGPLELLPIASYPRGWLRVKAAHDDRLAMALPATSDEPLKAYHEEMRLHQSLGVKSRRHPLSLVSRCTTSMDAIRRSGGGC
jgi:hypothetical protein